MSLARKGLLLSLSSYLTLVLGLAQTMILSRALGPAGSGQLAIFKQLFLMGTQVASLGLPMAMIHAINTKRISPPAAVKSVLIASRAMSVAAVTITGLILYFGGEFFGEVGFYVYASMAVFIPTVISRAVYFNANTALLEAGSMAKISCYPLALGALLYAALWFFGKTTVENALVIEALTAGVVSWLLAIRLSTVFSERKKSEVPFDPGYVKGSIGMGLHLVAADILVTLNGYILLVLLRWLSGDFSEVGYFTRGLSVATLSIVSIRSLQRFMYSHWASLEPEERARQVERTVNVGIMMALIAGSFIALLAKPITIVLFGKSFLPAVAVSRISLIGVCVYLVSQLLQSLFNAAGENRYSLIVLGSGIVSNAAAGFLLIPKWGAAGCASAALFGYFTMTMFSVYFAVTRFGLGLGRMLVPAPALLGEIVKRIAGRK